MAAKRRIPRESGANRGNQPGAIRLLNNGMRAGLLRFIFQIGRCEHGVENDGRSRKKGADASRGAEPVALRHNEIEKNEVGLEGRRFLNGRFAVVGHGANLPFARGGAQKRGDGVANRFAVISD